MASVPTANSILEMLVGDIQLSDIDAKFTDDSTVDNEENIAPSKTVLNTPNIDAVLAEKKDAKGQAENFNKHEIRIKQLEDQLMDVLAQNKKQEQDLSHEISEIITSSETTSPKLNFKTRPPPKRTSKLQKMKQAKEIDKGTYLSLVKELEDEREARWKAEQAAKKLVQLMRNISAENNQRKQVQETTSQATERLKESLLKERRLNEELRAKSKMGDNEKDELTQELNEKQTTQHQLKDKLREVKSKFDHLKSQAVKKETHFMQCSSTYEAKIAALKKEIDLSTAQNKTIQDQTKQVQELLIEREKEHRVAVEHHYTLDSPEFQNAVSREINKVAEHHHKEVQNLENTILICRKDYKQLEDEFREALYIEADRYSSVSNAYQEKCSAFDAVSRSHRDCKEREERTKNMMQELTTIAKEQKMKLTEMTKCRSEMEAQFKDRIFALETQNEKNHRASVKLELIKEEKGRLLSKVTALQSIVDGLKDERKLWGQELAQQGVNLTKDRGRLESKIEALNMEISSLRKQNSRDLDTLKIKTKIADDQTETIRRMKEALQEKDNKIKDIQDEVLDHQRKLENDVEDLTQENASLQQKMSYLQQRKEELKTQKVELADDYEKLQQDHSKLVKKWAEKGQVLSQVETHVKKMKEAFEKKEEKFKIELQQANQEKMGLTQRMERIDDEFQKQLNMIKRTHENDYQRVTDSKNQEVKTLQGKISSLEEEMREILRDTKRQKQVMQSKLHKANAAFQDLQEDLSL